MGEGRISGRQFGVLTFVLMLAPLIHGIPARAAGAGRGGWLLILPAAVPLTLLLRTVLRCLDRMPEGSGLGDLYLLALGGRWGKVFCALSALWVLMIQTADLRFCAERFVTAVYPDTGRWVFCLTMLALTLWIARGTLEALTRAGRILFWVVTVTLVLVLAMAAPKTHIYNVWPVTDLDPREAARSVLRVMTVLSFAVPPCFLLGRVTRRPGGREVYLWAAIVTAAALLIGAVIFAVFGPELAGRLEAPFFALAKEISFRRTVQGMEVVVAAMWAMSDIALMGMNAFVLGALGGALLPRAGEERIRTASVAVTLVLCLLLPVSSFRMEELYRTWAMPADLIAGYGLPLVALAAGKLRSRW